MKRISFVACLTALIVVLTSSVVFGSTALKIEEAYPHDGQKNTTVENMSVKLTFNNAVDSKENRKANEKCFTIKDDKGKALPIKVYYNPENGKQALILVDMTKRTAKDKIIKDNSEYTLTVDKSFVDNEGNALGKTEKISFTTLNQAWNTKIYMIMMVVMFGGMFFFSSRQAKKQMAQTQEDTKEEPFNPYKEAKKTGKPLAEVIAQHEKEEAKKAAKEARKAAKEHVVEEEEEEIEEANGNYRVKAAKPIAAAGGKYITGRKAAAEAKRAEEERLAKRRAATKKKKKK